MFDNITWKFWTNEYLGDCISWDTETEYITGPTHNPRLALTTAYGTGNISYVIKNDNLVEFFKIHKDSRLTAHNFAFDNNVVKTNLNIDLHDKVVNKKILDTAILYRLLGIAIQGFKPGKYNLALLSEKLLDHKLDKDDGVRLTFGEYINEDGSVRYEDIPDDHYKYAALDAVVTQKVKERLLKEIEFLPTSTNLSHDIQLMGELALYDINKNGIEIDNDYVHKLSSELEKDIQTNKEIMAIYGLTKGKGFQTKYENIMSERGIHLPLTGKTKKMSMKMDDLLPYQSDHFIGALLTYLGIKKRNDFLVVLKDTKRIHPRYGSIKNTLRTGCSKPNIQNPPREGGVREAFIAKPGHVLVDIDYSSIELYALAFICMNKFGYSVLYDKLNAGADIHVYAASKIFDKPESEISKDERQVAKIANYGLAANMGGATFQRHMASQGVDITEDRAIEIKKIWVKAFPEIKQFWKMAQGRSGLITDTGFIRNHCSYTAYLNTQFQSK